MRPDSGAKAPLFHYIESSVGVDLEDHVDLGSIVELAYRFGVALVAVELRVDFVVDGTGERREAIGAILTDDVGLDGARARVGHIDDSVGKGIIATIEDLAEQQLADRFLALLVGGGTERSAKADENQTANRSNLCHYH